MSLEELKCNEVNFDLVTEPSMLVLMFPRHVEVLVDMMFSALVPKKNWFSL